LTPAEHLDNLAAGRITPEEATRRFDALGATPICNTRQGSGFVAY